MTDCVFCRIVKGEIPSFKVYEDDTVFAFEDINPIADGHTLIVPRAHYETLWEMPPEAAAAVGRASHRVVQAIRRALRPAGVAVLQLNGAAVNQVVMHYHMHLIPRQESDPELSMTRWDLVPGDMERIDAIGRRIAAAVR